MTPDRVALVFHDRAMTYRELADRVTRLAHVLERSGVSNGDRVAFLGKNHPAALEVLFAAGLVGAIAVPVHPGFDVEGIARVLDASRPALLVATGELLAAAHRAGRAVGLAHVTSTERLDALVARADDAPIDRPVGLEDGCLVAFSSGTTGPNKGVALTHGNILFNAVNTLLSVDLRRGDAFLSSAPLYRMGGLGFTLGVLLEGGMCVLTDADDADRSLALIERHRVDVLFEPPGALEAMTRSPRFASADLSSVRVCVTGGSPIPRGLVRAFEARGLPLQPGYGLTEAAPVALLADPDEVASTPGAAGRSVFFCASRVVGDDGRDVLPGEAGELWISGLNVTNGYFADPAATSRVLVDGWLRTGDSARASADGVITILGRVADDLLLDGKRVHPGPLEDALRDVEGVGECAIVQASAGAPPIVFLEPDGARPIGRDRVLALLRDAGVPAPTLEVVSELPRNPNGKIVRPELRARAARIDSPERTLRSIAS